MKYRQRRGRWRSPDDLRRLYGLSEEDFQRLRPYIRIAKADQRGRYKNLFLVNPIMVCQRVKK